MGEEWVRVYVGGSTGLQDAEPIRIDNWKRNRPITGEKQLWGNGKAEHWGRSVCLGCARACCRRG